MNRETNTKPSAVEALPTPTTYRLEDRGFGLAMHVVESGEGEWIRTRDHAAVHAAMCRRIDALAASQEAPKAGACPETLCAMWTTPQRTTAEDAAFIEGARRMKTAMLTAAPAPAGREAACYCVETPSGKWSWHNGLPPQGTLDFAAAHGYRIRYAYEPTHPREPVAGANLDAWGDAFDRDSRDD